ncbi:MAG: YwaF family protein [Clostridia bacterium]|nr:YwaF family protein [Clostridia bacterium]
MPEVFGTEHLLYLLICVIIATTSLIFIKKYVKTNKQKTILVKTMGVVLFIAIMCNRFACCGWKFDIQNFLPTTFCGTTSIVFSLTLIFAKPQSHLMQFASCCAFFGGILTMIYPDFIGQSQSIFFDKTITGLLHHTLMVYNFILILLIGYFKPTLKKWQALPLGLCVYMTYGIFNITVLGKTNSMQIYEPLLEGTPFTWFFTGMLFIILYTAFLIVYEYFAYKKEDRTWHTWKKIKNKK